MNNKTNSNQDFLKSTKRVGSIKIKKEFNLNENAFSDQKILPIKLERRKDVLKWKKYKTFQGVTNEIDKSNIAYVNWNNSMKFRDMPLVESRKMENFVQDRSNNYNYNYRASLESLELLKNIEPIDKSTKFHISTQTPQQILALQTLRNTSSDVYTQKNIQKRTQEMPNHPSLVDSIPWSQSTVILPSDIDNINNTKLQASLKWTRYKSQSLGTTIPYKTKPIQTQIDFQNTVREQKRLGIFDPSKQLNIPNPTGLYTDMIFIAINTSIHVFFLLVLISLHYLENS